MADPADVRRMALALPETSEGSDGLRFFVGGKQFCWPWMERIDPRKPRVPNSSVLAVRVANELEKQGLLALDPEVFFTEPHYDGYPAVLIRLAEIDLVLLDQVLTDAWRARAPRGLVRALDRLADPRARFAHGIDKLSRGDRAAPAARVRRGGP